LDEFAGVDGVKTVDVFGGIDGGHDAEGADVVGQWELDDVEDKALGGFGGEGDDFGEEAGGLGTFFLTADVDVAGRVVTDDDDAEAWTAEEKRSFGYGFGDDFIRELAAIDDRCAHCL
jgi:hypothetical protein